MAGLGSMFGWGENPFYQGFDQRRNAIGQLGVGLMQGKNWQEGLALGGQGALQGRQVDDANAIRAKEEAERVNSINKTVEWMRERGFDDLVAGVEGGGLDVQTAWGEALRRTQPQEPLDPTAAMQEYQYAVSQGYEGDFYDWKNQGGGAGGGLGTTIYTGRDANGNIVPMQVGQNGFVPSQLPEGVSFDPGALNAERAAGNVTGKGAGQAALDLAGARADAQRISLQIEDLKTHPGVDAIFGKTMGIIPNQWGPTMPGSDKANAMARIEQMSGNAFLNGRQMLKGGGAITDFESNKAEAAFARLSTAQSKEEFIKGLDEFNAALAAGIAKLEAASGQTSLTSGFGPSPTNYITKYGLE